MTIRKYALTFVVLGLAACGSNGVYREDDAVLTERNLNEFRENFLAIESKLLQPEITFTDFTALPAKGLVSYDGVLFLGPVRPAEEAEPLAGSLTLQADFDTGAINGVAGAFVNADDQRRVGALIITGGKIFADSFDTGVFEAQANGDITFDSGRRTVSARVVGDFSGPEGELLDGELAGEGVSPDGDTVSVVGGFLAERR